MSCLIINSFCGCGARAWVLRNIISRISNYVSSYNKNVVKDFCRECNSLWSEFEQKNDFTLFCD